MGLNERLNYLLFFLLGVVLATGLFAAIDLLRSDIMLGIPKAVINTNDTIIRSIPIVAVNQNEESGTIGALIVKLVPGNNSVLVDINPFVEPDLQYSANMAIDYAKSKTGSHKLNKDFILTYNIQSNVIGGGSAGAATAIAAIAAIQNKTLKPRIAITGTINPDGSIGSVGGVLEKAKAVGEAGYRTFLVPRGQTKIRYYEQVVDNDSSLGYLIQSRRYVPRTADLKDQIKKEWGVELIEVSNVDQALQYMLE